MTTRIHHLLTASAVLTGLAAAQNDECTGAITVSLGSTPYDTTTATLSAPAWPCASGGAPDLWYTFTAPNAARYRFETCGASYDSAIEIFDGTCAALNPLFCNDDSCGLQSVVQVDGMPGDVFYVRVGGWNGSTGLGDLTVTEILPQPLTLVGHWPLDDTTPVITDISGSGLNGTYIGGMQGVAGAAPGTGNCVDFDGLAEYGEIGGAPVLEDLGNDFSATAWFMIDGPAQFNSSVHRIFGNEGPSGSWSFGARLTGAPSGGAGLRLTTHTVLDYDIDANVMMGQWHHVAVVMDIDNDVTFYLDGQPVGTVTGSNPARPAGALWLIGAWFTSSATVPEFFNGKIDDVQVYGGSLTAQDVLDLYNNPGSTKGGSGIGTRYCTPAVANSTGNPATLNVEGSVLVNQNDVTLTATDMPNNAFGFFLTSRTQGFTANPGGSDGNLCLSGAIGRYVGAGQIQNSGQAGEISLTLDLTQTPTPTGLVSVLPGETWNFQGWHRDAVGGVATSNFTDGVSVLFN